MRLRGPTGQPLAQHIAETAARLFYADGIHLVGVDRIADAAGITKRTLYRHFRAKDELIAGALRYAPRVPFPDDGTPLERVAGAFDALEAFLTDDNYRGCPYVIFAAELTDRTHPARRLIERYLVKRREWFFARAADAGASDAKELAEELDVLFDGAVASGAKRGDVIAVKTAKRVAVRIFRSATRHARTSAHGASRAS